MRGTHPFKQTDCIDSRTLRLETLERIILESAVKNSLSMETSLSLALAGKKENLTVSHDKREETCNILFSHWWANHPDDPLKHFGGATAGRVAECRGAKRCDSDRKAIYQQRKENGGGLEEKEEVRSLFGEKINMAS